MEKIRSTDNESFDLVKKDNFDLVKFDLLTPSRLLIRVCDFFCIFEFEMTHRLFPMNKISENKINAKF
jgi:hypothetical protein